MTGNMKKKIVVAICGASGSIYGIRVLKALLNMPCEVHLCISKAGRQVMAHEVGYDDGLGLTEFLKTQEVEFHKQAELRFYDPEDLFAPISSGSFQHQGMIVAPCSMKTLGVIAAGISSDLISRAADVCLKEKRPLVLLTRETPLSLIHIENMRRAALTGATIMPPCPGFYFRPKTVLDLVDATVARALDQVKMETNLMKRWGD
jgi:4-hydroxy-3-polyprenylbenzoate decarboxylase